MTIEFLPSDEAPELLPGAPAVPHRRWWWLLAAAVVVTAVTYALNRPSAPSHPQAQFRAVAACRGVPDCAVRENVPAQIARLARADLPPGIRLRVRSIVSVDSITHEELLVSRSITATTDWVTITIQIKRGTDDAARTLPNPLSFRSVMLHRVNSGFIVRLQYLAPATFPPRLDRLETLIRDSRLATSVP